VHFKPIKITRILDATVELTEGVSTEDRIINNPSAAILEGDKVSIVTPAPGYDLISVPKEPGSSKPASHSEMSDTKPKQALNGTDEPIINNPGVTLPEGDKVSAVTPAPGHDPTDNAKESVPKSSKPASHSEMPDPMSKQPLNGSHAP
ncbi:MAG: hypothetical protein ABIR00_00150, partial [Nitrosospira sp.]